MMGRRFGSVWNASFVVLRVEGDENKKVEFFVVVDFIYFFKDGFEIFHFFFLVFSFDE